MKTLLLTLAAAFAVVSPVALAHGPDQAPHQMAELGEFRLEGGGVINNLRMSYVTHGTLNEARDNAILFVHGFAANHHTDHLIGPGKAFDTNKYYVIASDSFGSTQTGFDHSTSATTSGLKMDFPPYNGRDMINAEHKFVTAGLGIDHLVAVAGISMGGGKALQFAVSHPDFMDAAISIVGSAGLSSSMSFLADLLLRSAIENCAGWEGGNYDENPRNCAAAALTGIIPQFYTRDWWDENVASDEEFKAWHRRWWDTYLGVQYARDLYLMSTAPGAVADTPGFKGDLAAALGAIKAKVLFIISPHDQFQSAELIEKQDAMILDSRILSIDRNTGHMICCGEDLVATGIMTKEIATFLDALGR